MTPPTRPTVKHGPAPLTRIVELACLAPSVHNTQPWRWQLRDNEIELYADHDRQLAVSDPVGRNLVISCGAALHHAQVAARALGWMPRVARLPDPDNPDLLARLELAPHPPSHSATEALEALQNRVTDRRRFTSWPVPGERLVALVSAAVATGAAAVAVTDAVDRVQVELGVSRALDLQERDQDLVTEQRLWRDHGAHDGIPTRALPERVAESRSRRSRFYPELLDESQRQLVDGYDGIVVLGGRGDDVADWLATGEALSALWLRATLDGLAVVPLSQAIEVAETRTTLEHGVLGGRVTPHLLIRVGWQPMGRRDLTRTPRRPVADVLLSPAAHPA